MTDSYGVIADIGGTNARFAIADKDGYYEEKVLQCNQYPSLHDMVSSYMDSLGERKIKKGAFAVAGPVDGDHFFAVNLPWEFSIHELGESLGFEEFKLYNDFSAITLALPYFKDSDLRQHGGKFYDRSGVAMATIGPGTGLGVGGIIRRDGNYHVIPTEGGHVTIAARSDREYAVISSLQKEMSHVSAERVCSGQGLENIYRVLRNIDGCTDLPELEASEISSRALRGECEICRESLDMMMRFLGRTASNLVLSLGAWKGVYIAGGIVNKLGEYFYSSPFREEFDNKGRFNETMTDVPVFVIKHSQPALLGLQSKIMLD